MDHLRILNLILVVILDSDKKKRSSSNAKPFSGAINNVSIHAVAETSKLPFRRMSSRFAPPCNAVMFSLCFYSLSSALLRALLSFASLCFALLHKVQFWAMRPGRLSAHLISKLDPLVSSLFYGSNRHKKIARPPFDEFFDTIDQQQVTSLQFQQLFQVVLENQKGTLRQQQALTTMAEALNALTTQV